MIEKAGTTIPDDQFAKIKEKFLLGKTDWPESATAAFFLLNLSVETGRKIAPFFPKMIESLQGSFPSSTESELLDIIRDCTDVMSLLVNGKNELLFNQKQEELFTKMILKAKTPRLEDSTDSTLVSKRVASARNLPTPFAEYAQQVVQIPPESDVLSILNEQAPKGFTEVRKFSDERGLYVWTITIPGKEEGEILEIEYLRRGRYPEGKSVKTSIQLNYYANQTDYENQMPQNAGDTIADYIDGEWGATSFL